MSNSKLNVTTDSLFSRAKNTHYAVSTFAAVVYALVWLLSNGAHAESTQMEVSRAVLPAVVVTAQRPVVLPAVVVVATREVAPVVAILDAVIVTGERDSAERVANANATAQVSRVGYFSKVRTWIRATLGKVSG